MTGFHWSLYRAIAMTAWRYLYGIRHPIHMARAGTSPAQVPLQGKLYLHSALVCLCHQAAQLDIGQTAVTF